MERPRSAHRDRSSAADHGEATKSGSKISTPSKPAAAAAISLSSRVPDRHTVATAVRRPTVVPRPALVGTAVSAALSAPFIHQASLPAGPVGGYPFPASERPGPLSAATVVRRFQRW